MNIHDSADRQAIIDDGFRWVLVSPRGQDKGHVISRHRTLAAATDAVTGRELEVVDLDEAAGA